MTRHQTSLKFCWILLAGMLLTSGTEEPEDYGRYEFLALSNSSLVVTIGWISRTLRSKRTIFVALSVVVDASQRGWSCIYDSNFVYYVFWTSRQHNIYVIIHTFRQAMHVQWSRIWGHISAYEIEQLLDIHVCYYYVCLLDMKADAAALTLLRLELRPLSLLTWPHRNAYAHVRNRFHVPASTHTMHHTHSNRCRHVVHRRWADRFVVLCTIGMWNVSHDQS